MDRRLQMKPGDRVTWLRSPGHSFLSGWRVQRIPGVIERVCAARIKIRVRIGGREKVVAVAPDNVIWDEEAGDGEYPPQRGRTVVRHDRLPNAGDSVAAGAKPYVRQRRISGLGLDRVICPIALGSGFEESERKHIESCHKVKCVVGLF